MKDLIQLLRLECGHDSFSVPGCASCEAADALEKLQAENERLSTLCDKWNSECDDFREENKRLAAENSAQALVIEKMREAMDNIAWKRHPSERLAATYAAEYEAIAVKALALDTSAATELLRKRDADVLRNAAEWFRKGTGHWPIAGEELCRMANKIERGEA